MDILKHIPVTACDIIFLSYDEPNAEENWKDLKKKYPEVKRVHGIKGINAAHKECARQSETQRFITVDGDNIVYQNFFKETIDYELFNSTKTISWYSKNNINGLIYGNGGLKCWNKEFALHMKSHEHSEGKITVDFYMTFLENRLKHDNCFSETIINEDPYQAWKAGFREGIKFSLYRNERIEKQIYLKKGKHLKNKNWLNVWFTKGVDVKNGPWAIYGAMMGCYLSFFTNFDINIILDYEKLFEYWNKEVFCNFVDAAGSIKNQLLLKQIKKLQDFFDKYLPFQQEVVK